MADLQSAALATWLRRLIELSGGCDAARPIHSLALDVSTGLTPESLAESVRSEKSLAAAKSVRLSWPGV